MRENCYPQVEEAVVLLHFPGLLAVEEAVALHRPSDSQSKEVEGVEEAVALHLSDP